MTRWRMRQPVAALGKRDLGQPKKHSSNNFQKLSQMFLSHCSLELKTFTSPNISKSLCSISGPSIAHLNPDSSFSFFDAPTHPRAPESRRKGFRADDRHTKQSHCAENWWMTGDVDNLIIRKEENMFQNPYCFLLEAWTLTLRALAVAEKKLQVRRSNFPSSKIASKSCGRCLKLLKLRN